MSKSRIIKKFTLNFLFILIMGFVFISCNQEPPQINGYTVEFSGNAETVSGSTKSLDAPYDKNVTLTENGFTRTGYTFSKWNTEADGSGTDYQDKATVKNLTTGKNITLYAQWTPNTYTIHFNGNAEEVTGTMKSINATYDSDVILRSNAFNRPDYVFNGWYSDPNGAGTRFGNKASVRNLANGGEVTLYAQWIQNAYTIEFDANAEEVSGTTESMTVLKGQSVTLTLNGFTRTGYTFSKWTTEAGGTGTEREDGASVSNLTEEESITLYAQWTPNTYNIVFNANGGQGSTGTVPATYGTSVTLTPNRFTKEGYTFSHWSTDANGTGDGFTDGQTVNSLISSGSIILFAIWTPNNYTIQFGPNGGEGTTESVTATYDVNATLTANGFIRTGYTFSKWNTESNGDGTSYENGENVINLVTSGTITLYAQWTANTYTIQFDSNGGEGTTASVHATYDTNVTLTANKFTRTGYTFSKWNTKANGEGTSYEDKDDTVSNLTPSGTITLYAIWTANEYTIQFAANGGEGNTSPVDAIYGINVSLTPNVFTRTGYTFSKWNTKANGEGTSYENGENVINLVSSGTITLYAIWKPNKYTIQFDANGGQGTTESVTATYGVDVILTANGFTRTGYEFSEWNTKADGTGDSYINKRTVSNLVSSGTVTLYAQWTANTYTIQFDSNGGTGTTEFITAAYGVDVILTANGFTRTGYEFSKWNTETDGSGTDYQDKATVKNLATEGDVTLYAIWTANTYTIQFNSNGGEGTTESVTATYGVNVKLTENKFTRTGYSFSHWSTDANGTGDDFTDGQENIINLVTSGTITLYAQWTENSYTIVFNSNGGEGTIDSINVNYSKNIVLPTNTFTKDGYTFTNWATNANGNGYTYNDNQTVSKLVTSGTITLYAQWSQNTYTIVFNSNGGEGTTKSVTATYGVNVNLTANGFTRTGYTFSKWNTKANGEGDSYENGENVVNLVASGTVTLYAQWTANKYTIQFGSNGGEGTIDSITAIYGANVTLTANGFSRTGYTFSKWNTKANGEGTSYENGENVINLAASGTITLYAIWTPNKYTIVFNSNIGSGTTESVTVAYDEEVVLNLSKFSKAGYTLSRWTTQSDGYGESYNYGDSVSKLATGGIFNLYAQWTPTNYTITYELNGGTASNPASYTIESKTFVLIDPERSGYVFSGWTWEGQNTPSKNVTILQGSTGNKVYIANWVANSAEPEI